MSDRIKSDLTRSQQSVDEAPREVTAGTGAQTDVELLQAIADALPVRVAYLDREQRMGFINRSGCERHGRTRAELVGRPAAELISALRTDKGMGLLQAAYSGQAQRFEHDDESDGRRLRVETHITPDFDSGGQVRGLFVFGLDITALKQAERELRDQTVTLNAIIESIPAMVAVVDPQLRYRLINRAYEGWRKRVRTDLIGHDLQECLETAEFQRSLPFAQQALAGETVSYELHNPTAAEIRHVAVTLVPLRLEDGSGTGFISIAHDITLQREEKDRLELLSERDPLTGLLNRAGFEKYLSQKLRQGEGRSCGLLYIDLDHFKPINDSHGHAAGDEVLREFAARLLAAVRPTDAVARLGGDEFAIVLAGLRKPENATRIAHKVVELASVPFRVADDLLLLSASVGVAFNADAEGGWKGLVQRADALLYQAKAASRARPVFESGSHAA